MLGEIEGKRRRGRQRVRWLDGITESMDMNLGGGAPGDNEGQGGLGRCSPWGCRVRHDLVTEQQQRAQNGARTLKASTYIMSSEISLAKVSHVTKPNFTGAGTLTQLTSG